MRLGMYCWFEINLLEQRREEFVGLEIEQILPIIFAAIHDAAVAQVEQVGGHQRRLGMVSQDVDVLAFGGGDLLLLLHLFHGGDQIAQSGRFFKARRLRTPVCIRPRNSRARSLWRPSRNSFTSRTAAAYASSVVKPWTHGPRQRWM